MLGSGAEQEALERQARGLGVAGSVVFLGGVQDVSPYVRAADGFVLPSRTEGLPVALLEAMAAGLPSVATAVGGSVQVLADGVSGTLVRSESPEALAAAICQQHERPEPAARRGIAGRQVAVERYALSRVADAYLALYASLMGARTAASEPQASLDLSGFRKG